MKNMLLLALAVVVAGCGRARQSRSLKNVTRCDLAEPERIQDVPCKQFAVFFDAGTLMSCRLSEDADIGTTRLPEHTIVRFHEDGGLWYAFLQRPTEINGCLCEGSGSEGSITAFYESGNHHSCTLSEDLGFDGSFHKRGTCITLQDAPGSCGDSSGVQRP